MRSSGLSGSRRSGIGMRRGRVMGAAVAMLRCRRFRLFAWNWAVSWNPTVTREVSKPCAEALREPDLHTQDIVLATPDHALQFEVDGLRVAARNERRVGINCNSPQTRRTTPLEMRRLIIHRVKSRRGLCGRSRAIGVRVIAHDRR